MPDRRLLVLDLGLSELKATLFTHDGTTLARAQRPVETRSPHPGWFVQEPEQWWMAAIHACRDLWSRAGADHLHGVAVTGHMHAPVLIDAARRAVGECPIIWDRRAAADWADIAAAFDAEAFHHVTGGRLGPQTVPAKLVWMSRRAADTMRRATALLAPKDYLRLRLTNEVVTDLTDAAGMLLFDIHRGRWAKDVAAVCGADALLPPIVPSTALAGAVTADAAAALGVLMGTPVVAGAGDDVEALGAGANSVGDVYEHLGSTGTLGVVTDKPILDPQARVETVPHPSDGRWIVGGSTNVASAALDRIRRLLAGDGKSRRLAAAPRQLVRLTSNPYFLPYLSGERAPRWDESLRGAFVGLDLETERGELMHAVLEGIAFSLRDIGEVLTELRLPMHTVYSSGGAAAVPGWAQLRASVYCLPVVTPSDGDTTGRGMLMLAAVALGVYPSLEKAFEATAVESQTHQPDPAAAASYEVRYQAFRFLVDALTPWFRRHQPLETPSSAAADSIPAGG